MVIFNTGVSKFSNAQFMTISLCSTKNETKLNPASDEESIVRSLSGTSIHASNLVRQDHKEVSILSRWIKSVAMQIL